MWRYFELLSFRPLGEIAALHKAVEQGGNPRDVKFELAREIVARFHSAAAAEHAQGDFTHRVHGGVPAAVRLHPVVLAHHRRDGVGSE